MLFYPFPGRLDKAWLAHAVEEVKVDDIVCRFCGAGLMPHAVWRVGAVVHKNEALQIQPLTGASKVK